jgi:ABC-type lipoprotein release transport system permease subunit
MLHSILYHVDARDPRLLSAAAGVLLVVALAACVGPARRAGGANPAGVLRSD